jgi:hypothetical protein
MENSVFREVLRALEERGLMVRRERCVILVKGGSEMRKYPTDERLHEDVWEEAIRSAAAAGLLYDTGRRKWSERTRSYQIVWGRVPPKNQQN